MNILCGVIIYGVVPASILISVLCSFRYIQSWDEIEKKWIEEEWSKDVAEF